MATRAQPKLSRAEKIVEKYHSLRQQMVNLQKDHMNLLQEAQKAKPNTTHALETRKKIEKRRKEIDSLWKQIQKMAPQVARAQVPAAKKTYQRTKEAAKEGYREYGEAMSLIHQRDPRLERTGRAQLAVARQKIDPHVQAIISRQEAERRAIDRRSINWGTPPSRLKKVIGAVRRTFTGRRKAA